MGFFYVSMCVFMHAAHAHAYGIHAHTLVSRAAYVVVCLYVSNVCDPAVTSCVSENEISSILEV